VILMIVDRVSGRGTFVADDIDRDAGTWTATGRWLYSSGRRSDPPATYTWPTHRVLEIRHDWEHGS
jgi:hypothetical protein